MDPDYRTPPLPPDVAASLAAARQRLGIGFRELGRRAGITHGWVRRLEQREGSRPSAATVERLLAVLPMSPDEASALRDAAAEVCRRLAPTR